MVSTTLKTAFCVTMVVVTLTPSVVLSNPDGFVTYEGHKDQFTIALPEGWTTYDQAAALSGNPSATGVIIFSAHPIAKEDEVAADPEILARVDTGEEPSFFLDRQPATKGMSCAKFSKNAAYNLGVRLTEDPIFSAGRRFFSVTPIKYQKINVAGCQGVHFKKEAKKKGWMLDVRAFSDGKTLYLFSLRNKTENYAENIETFERAFGTLQLTALE